MKSFSAATLEDASIIPLFVTVMMIVEILVTNRIVVKEKRILKTWRKWFNPKRAGTVPQKAMLVLKLQLPLSIFNSGADRSQELAQKHELAVYGLSLFFMVSAYYSGLNGEAYTNSYRYSTTGKKFIRLTVAMLCT